MTISRIDTFTGTASSTVTTNTFPIVVIASPGKATKNFGCDPIGSFVFDSSLWRSGNGGIKRHRSLMQRIHRFYSNRVPAAVAQKVAITLSLVSKTLTTECVTNSSPLAPSSKADVTFCDPIKTPLEL
jgi:hypothetical protein